MNYINRNLILDCLRELSDRELQENLWMGRIANQQSSFEEAVEGLFTDSGLSAELSKSPTGFSADVETKLRELQRQLSRVDTKGGSTKVINNSAMSGVRDLAAIILGMLSNEMK